MLVVLNLVVKLSSVDQIHDFVKKCSKLDCDIDLIAGRYTVDAKSILGVFSVDLSRNLKLNIYTENKEYASNLLKDFVIS